MAAGDPYWNNVVLALHMDGTNGSTTFTDLKGNTVAPSGNAQISTAQSKFGGASALFDGAGDFLTIPTASAGTGGVLDLSKSAFTIECFYRTNSAVLDQQLFVIGEPTVVTTASLQLALGHYGSALGGKMRATAAVLGVPYNADSTFNLSTGTWYHIAVVKDSTVRLYIDGALQATSDAFVSSLNTSATHTARIGVLDGAGTSRPVSGYIDDVRITKGIARYTANFTPPALAFPNAPAQISGTVKDSTGTLAPRAVRAYRKSDGALAGATVSHSTTGVFSIPALDASAHFALTHDSDADPYWPNVVLATHFDTDSVIDPYMSSVVLGLHMEGANASTVFQDVTGKTVTPTATTISTAQSKFGASSALFNGTTSVLSVPTDTGFNFTGDFTIEGWCYWSALPAASNSTIFAAKYTSVADQRSWLLRLYNTAGVYNLQMLLTPNGVFAGTELIASSSLTVTAGSWHHVVCTRSAGVVRLFFNGVIVGSATSAISTYAGSAPLMIGYTTDFTYFDGYIDDLRITKGVARYTANFTPPTAPFSSFKDLTGKDLMVSGVPSINTGTKKYGDAALLLSGSGNSFVSTARSADFDFGFGDWTVEVYVQFNAVNTNQGIVAFGASGGVPILLYLSSTAELRLYMSSVGVWDIASALPIKTSVSTGTWYHVAISKKSSTAYCFVDGVQTNRVNVALALAAATSEITIGSWASGGSLLNGYIDDLRITKGVARYLSDFTPPERAFPGAVGAGTANAQIFDDLIPI